MWSKVNRLMALLATVVVMGASEAYADSQTERDAEEAIGDSACDVACLEPSDCGFHFYSSLIVVSYIAHDGSMFSNRLATEIRT